MVAASDIISVVATTIALGSLGVAISSDRKAGPRLKSAAKLQKSGSTPHGLKLELKMFNTGLASTRVSAIYLLNQGLFGPIWVTGYAVEEGPKHVDGHEIGPNDGSRWIIDVDRAIQAADDKEITDEYFRSIHGLLHLVLRTVAGYAMAATLALVPRAIKRDFLQVVVVFKNGVEFRTPVMTGWLLQARWMSDLAREELKRRGLNR